MCYGAVCSNCISLGDIHDKEQIYAENDQICSEKGRGSEVDYTANDSSSESEHEHEREPEFNCCDTLMNDSTDVCSTYSNSTTPLTQLPTELGKPCEGKLLQDMELKQLRHESESQITLDLEKDSVNKSVSNKNGESLVLTPDIANKTEYCLITKKELYIFITNIHNNIIDQVNANHAVLVDISEDVKKSKESVEQTKEGINKCRTTINNTLKNTEETLENQKGTAGDKSDTGTHQLGTHQLGIIES